MKTGPEALRIPVATKDSQRSSSVFNSMFELMADGGRRDLGGKGWGPKPGHSCALSFADCACKLLDAWY